MEDSIYPWDKSLNQLHVKINLLMQNNRFIGMFTGNNEFPNMVQDLF